MPKHEDPMVERWWAADTTQGTLMMEFPLVTKTQAVQCRRIDALVMHGEGKTRASCKPLPSIAERDVTVVQAKSHRLGPQLIGQAVGSEFLAKRSGARSVRSVVIAGPSHPDLVALAEKLGLTVVIDAKARSTRFPWRIDERIISASGWGGGPFRTEFDSDFDFQVAVHEAMTGELTAIATPRRYSENSGAFGMSTFGVALVSRALLAARGLKTRAVALSTKLDPVMCELCDAHGVEYQQVNVPSWTK